MYLYMHLRLNRMFHTIVLLDCYSRSVCWCFSLSASSAFLLLLGFSWWWPFVPFLVFVDCFSSHALVSGTFRVCLSRSCLFLVCLLFLSVFSCRVLVAVFVFLLVVLVSSAFFRLCVFLVCFFRCWSGLCFGSATYDIHCFWIVHGVGGFLSFSFLVDGFRWVGPFARFFWFAFYPPLSTPWHKRLRCLGSPSNSSCLLFGSLEFIFVVVCSVVCFFAYAL